MRIRTLFAFSTGIVTGAATVYLLDPDHGRDRRHEAARWAATQAKDQARDAGSRLLDATRETVSAAAEGYRESAPTDV